MTTSAPRRVSVERLVAAEPSAIFAVLADPARHAEFDGSGDLLAARPGPAPGFPLGPGSVFVTPMGRRPRGPAPAQLIQAAVAVGRRGRMRNTVVEFERDRCIAWRNFGRHVWRYELESRAEGPGVRTLVRETFDYATNLAPWLLEWAGFPDRNARAMELTLARLDALVTPARG
jgi:hypothetical protein